MANSGAFTISLDFELMWGVYDSRSMDEYGPNILGTRRGIEGMLRLFERHDVGATWAAVGLLFCHDKSEMQDRLQKSGLTLEHPKLMEYIETQVGNDVQSDPYHFGTDILTGLRQAPRQEIASHSFSHYGLLEPYASGEGFLADMRATKAIFNDLGVVLDSYIFARNQVDVRYLSVLADTGIKAFRGCPEQALYRPRPPSKQNQWMRFAKLVDSYVPLTDLSVKKLPSAHQMINTVASRFLRPCNVHAGPVNRMQTKRIKWEMSKAARKNNFYHLWWHPHNFGMNTEQNLATLDELLSHYQFLKETYNWPNRNMSELAKSRAMIGG